MQNKEDTVVSGFKEFTFKNFENLFGLSLRTMKVLLYPLLEPSHVWLLQTW